MARTISMQRFRFEQSIWQGLISDDATADRVGKTFNINRLFGVAGQRYGFVNCRYHDGVVLGYFTQEGAKEVVEYDESIRPRTTQVNSFEHMVFALHVSSGSVALQSTRVAGYVDLNLSEMRTGFTKAVEEILRESKVSVVRLFLNKDVVEITSDQLYVIFRNYPTITLNISELKGKSVPSYEDFKIFNPDYDRDIIFRQVFESDIQSSLDSLSLQSNDLSDLKSAALARLSARVGKIESLTVLPTTDSEQTGTDKLTIKTTVSDKFKVDISSDNETQPITQEDIEEVSAPLTLTMTVSGNPEDVTQWVRGVMRLGNYTDDDE